MSVHPYIDDISHAHASEESVTLSKTPNSAFTRIYYEPSQFLPCSLTGDEPSQCFYRHLEESGEAHPQQSLVSQDLLAVVALIAACHTTAPLCLFQLRLILSHLSRNFKYFVSISKLIPLDVSEVLGALRSWSDPLRLVEGILLGFSPPNQNFISEASNHGWGSVVDGRIWIGAWPWKESRFHVNILETLSVFRACQFFQPVLSSSSPGSDRQLHRSFLSGPNGRDQIPLAQPVSSQWCLDRSIMLRGVCSFIGSIQIVPSSIHPSRQPG